MVCAVELGASLVWQGLAAPCPVDSRLRGNDGPGWLCCLVVTLWSQCQALGQALVSSPIKETFAKLPSFPRRRESIVKMQLERLRI